LTVNTKNLLGYCGLYCGACGIYLGRIRQAVENLRKIISTYGFDKFAPELAKWEPAFQHYTEFENVLNGFVKMVGKCQSCVGGGGDPTCTVQECCSKNPTLPVQSVLKGDRVKKFDGMDLEL